MTDPIAQPNQEVSVGAAIGLVRTKLTWSRFRKRVRQIDLYRLCTRIEEAMFSEGGETLTGSARKFRAVKGDEYAAGKIRQIEHDERSSKLTRHELVVLARAFGLPDAFFFEPFGDFKALMLAFDTAQPGSGQESSPTAQAASPPARGFRRLGSQQALAPGRQEILEGLDRCLARADGEISLVLVEGPDGVGKGFLISRWFHDSGQEKVPGGALYLDCESLGVEDIIPQVDALFPRGGNAGEPRLVVCSNVRIGRFREGAPAENGDALPSIGAFIRQAVNLATQQSPTTVVVLLENNGPPVNDAVFVQDLGDARFERFLVNRLTPPEGARFLRELGNRSFDQKALEDISTLVMGLPISLTTVQSEIETMPQRDREQYLDRLKSGRKRRSRVGTEFDAFLKGYLQRLASDAGIARSDETQHPHALLRLLALMPGPLPLTHLKAMTGEGRITRLRALPVNDIDALGIPLIWVVDDAVDIHAMARATLRAELAAYRDSGQWDAHTSQKELEWLHWRRARLLWPIIARMADGDPDTPPDATNLAAVEGFVFHVCEQIHLLPREGRQANARRRKRPTSGSSAEDLKNFHEQEGRFSDAMLWQLAYQRAARPLLLDRHFRATRVHGQYSTKARILRYLLEAATAPGGAPVRPDDLADLQKEIGICHMHAGQLTAAQQAIGEAETLLLDEHPEVLHPIEDEQAASHHWARYCEVVSAATAVRIRAGDLASEAPLQLLRLAENAKGLINGLVGGATPPASTDRKRYLRHGERGALRLITRVAELYLLRDGDLEVAISAFSQASALKLTIGAGELEGEAARRWVQALIRGRNQNETRLGQAREIVRANLAKLQDSAQSATSAPADAIPFQLLQIALDRIEGRLEEAGEALAELGGQDALQRRECTFAAQTEFQLELLRLAIATGSPTEGAHRAALDLADRLQDSGHKMMEAEALLLAAELAPAAERAALVTKLRTYLSSGGWNLRLADVNILARGQSAVMAVGI